MGNLNGVGWGCMAYLVEAAMHFFAKASEP